MIFNVKLPVKQAENEIGIREEPNRQSGDRSPRSDLLIIDRPGNHPTRNDVCHAVHKSMLTCKKSKKQPWRISDN
jgi:hypothetical protein